MQFITCTVWTAKENPISNLTRVDRSTADDFLLLIVNVFRKPPGSALEMFSIMLQNSSQANYRYLDVV